MSDLASPDLINDIEGDKRQEAEEQQEADIVARIKGMKQDWESVISAVAYSSHLTNNAMNTEYDGVKKVDEILTNYLRTEVESEMGIE